MNPRASTSSRLAPLATIALFGFLNRWNDTVGTPLEDKPLAAGDRFLARGGWTPGKHRP
jgi:hypothetical protein